MFFSDGSDIEIIREHIFYNVDLGRYVTINTENVEEYIGKTFAKQDLENGTLKKITLTDVKYETRVTGVYEVVSYDHKSCFTNGILTSSAYIENLINIFDIDPETMAYDPEKMLSDILKYGVFNYDELSQYMTEDMYRQNNAAFLKVALGKGVMTLDEIKSLCDLYRSLAKAQPIDDSVPQGVDALIKDIPHMLCNYISRKIETAVIVPNTQLVEWITSIITLSH